MSLKMWLSFSLDITWYAQGALYAKNLLFTHSIDSKWSLVNNTREVIKSDKVEWVKNTIKQVIFLNGSMFNFLFYFILRESDFLLATVLPMKSKLSAKLQLFNTIDGNIEMLKNKYANIIHQVWLCIKNFLK